MKTSEAISILLALKSIADSGRLVPMKFAYASAINRRRLQDVNEAFNEGRRVLIDKFGAKDPDGKLLEKDGQVPITDPDAFTAEFVALGDTEHPELKLHLVALADMPAEMTLSEMEPLMLMVQEEAK